MSKEIKSYRLLVVEDNPGDYMLLEQYLTLRRLFGPTAVLSLQLRTSL